MEVLYKIGEFELTLDAIIIDIKDGKLSIYNVPISSITEHFIALLNEVKKEFEIADLSFFHRGVCELLYIKSASLLPRAIVFDDDDEEANLKNRVIDALEKLKFSKYLALLEQYRDEHSMDLSRFETSFILPYTDEDLLSGIRLNDLCVVYNQLLDNAGRSSPVFSLTVKIDSNEKLRLLLELFDSKDMVTFTELVQDLTSPEHITSAFNAILVAIHDRICTFKQETAFAEIYLYKINQDSQDDFEEEIYNEYDNVFSDDRDIEQEESKPIKIKKRVKK